MRARAKKLATMRGQNNDESPTVCSAAAQSWIGKATDDRGLGFDDFGLVARRGDAQA